MATEQSKRGLLQFGQFEVDLRTQELRKQGVRLSLPGQSYQILELLLLKPGQLVTREELQQALWPSNTFVDFDHGINAAVNRLRDALGDTADNPRYVETLSRRGYRFIAPITKVAGAAELTADAPDPKAGPATNANNVGKPRVWVLASAAAVLVLFIGVLIWQRAVFKSAAPRVLRFTQLTNDGQVKSGPLGTDRSRIYFNEVLPGPRNIVAQVSIHGGETVQHPVPLAQPEIWDVSEDGTELLLANGEGDSHSLWIVSVTGGSPRQVGTVTAHDARFGPGASVIYGTGGEIYSARRDGSEAKKLLNAGNVAFAFQYSPNTQFLRFSTFDVQRDDMAVLQAKADGSNFATILPGCCGRWIADGRYFVYQNRPDARVDLWALPEKRRSWGWKRENHPIQLTTGPLSFLEPLPSRDNKRVYAIGISRRAELVRYDEQSQRFTTYLSGISAEEVSFSKDGQWLAYASFPDGALWRSKIDGSDRQQLTFAPLRVSSPRWSPDGSQIAFSGDMPRAVRNVYVISRQGGTSRRVLASTDSQAEPTWSPDGNVIGFGTLFMPRSPIYMLDLRTHGVTTLPGSESHYAPQWSPDGKYIAAITTTNGSSGNLTIFDVAAGKWTELVGFPVDRPVWSSNGKFVYFRHLRNEGNRQGRESVSRIRLSDRKIEHVVDVEDLGRVTTGRFVDWFGLAPDDSVTLGRDMSTQEIYALDVEWP
jgi:DNA-binding winged helix-turn-helix (wHTH) protein